MAVVTLLAKTTIVNIILLMTLTTYHWRIARRFSGFMTRVTRQIFMFACKRIRGMCFVIKLPDIPCIGCMALVAGITNGAFMDIVLLMTGNTLRFGRNKLVADMAALTRHNVVHTY